MQPSYQEHLSTITKTSVKTDMTKTDSTEANGGVIESVQGKIVSVVIYALKTSSWQNERWPESVTYIYRTAEARHCQWEK